MGLPGVTVELEDTSGDVLATTTTDGRGHYSFNQLSGPAANVENASGVSGTGLYDVVLVLPSWLRQTTANPDSILISRGGVNVSGVNFGIGFNFGELSNSGGTQTAVDDLASLQTLASKGLQTPTSGNTVAPVSSATTQASTTGAQTSDAATTPSTVSTSSTLTPSSLLSFLQSLQNTDGAGLVDSQNQAAGSSSPPPLTWALDTAFQPDEFAKIADLLR
jgi:hypothetical protein